MLNPAFDEDDQNDGATDGMWATGSEGGPEGTDPGDTGDTGTPTDTPTGSGPGILEVPASFSACRGDEHSPTQCALYASDVVNAIAIDESSDTGDSLVACLMFALDDTLAGTTVNQVILEMHTIDESWASSDVGPEIWMVEPFTKADFDVALPLQIGVAPIASKPGVVPANVPIQWDLPLELVTENIQVYLCAYPLSGDGTYFYSHTGTSPPKLHIEYE